MGSLQRSCALCYALVGALSALAAPALAQVTTSGERIRYAFIVATDYAFDAPSTINEGIITFHLVKKQGLTWYILVHLNLRFVQMFLCSRF